ncbi:MAG TPA: phosphoenolpyruvate carboxykinase (ATP) [Miltoncostaeaceae bacterium]|nr:phosphoenolpyruvate carboxykinase (ATP) [Miltoncostaeaceae bacterium]
MAIDQATTSRGGAVGLETHGITPSGTVWWNLTAPALYEHAIAAGDAEIAEGGPLVVSTGAHTGRSPKDKFVVREPGSEDRVWWGDINQPISPENHASLGERLRGHLSGASDLYVIDSYAGADPKEQLSVRVVTESPWHALFAQTLFRVPGDEELERFQPQALILHAPSFTADGQADGVRQDNFVSLHLTDLEILIGGTYYAGEIKKSIFTLMNDRLPHRGVLSMHCSANVGADGRVALFFGLSGTGKTTLSTDSTRPLIGDDEHGWSDDGVFNIEGGCYAKVINLSPEGEPEIYATTRMFGTVLENVVMDPATRRLDLDDASKTENTRAAYPLESIPNTVPDARAGHPSAIVMLTADAFGVLPPVAKLTSEQAMDLFLAGYTAKVAGTEVGVVEPQATFSACFGAAFLPQPPAVYAELLGGKIEEHQVSTWLVNTGWTGGPYGTGSRMPIGATRAIVRAALSGELDDAPTRTDPNFGFEVPTAIEGVDPALLDPRGTWADPAAYDASAKDLAARIGEHAAKMRA